MGYPHDYGTPIETPMYGEYHPPTTPQVGLGGLWSWHLATSRPEPGGRSGRSSYVVYICNNCNLLCRYGFWMFLGVAFNMSWSFCLKLLLGWSISRSEIFLALLAGRFAGFLAVDTSPKLDYTPHPTPPSQTTKDAFHSAVFYQPDTLAEWCLQTYVNIGICLDVDWLSFVAKIRLGQDVPFPFQHVPLACKIILLINLVQQFQINNHMPQKIYLVAVSAPIVIQQNLQPVIYNPF